MGMFFLDQEIFKGIMRITSNILVKYFYYDKEALARFYDYFGDTMQDEYVLWEETADKEYKRDLRHDPILRKHFTSYFVSYHLHDVLVQNLYFTEVELDCFENILPKYTGEIDDTKQSSKRARY